MNTNSEYPPIGLHYCVVDKVSDNTDSVLQLETDIEVTLLDIVYL